MALYKFKGSLDVIIVVSQTVKGFIMDLHVYKDRPCTVFNLLQSLNPVITYPRRPQAQEDDPRMTSIVPVSCRNLEFWSLYCISKKNFTTFSFLKEEYKNMLTNNYIESWHNQLKSTYLKRLKNRRLGRLVYILTREVEKDMQADVRRVDLGIGRMGHQERARKMRQLDAKKLLIIDWRKRSLRMRTITRPLNLLPMNISSILF